MKINIFLFLHLIILTSFNFGKNVSNRIPPPKRISFSPKLGIEPLQWREQ